MADNQLQPVRLPPRRRRYSAPPNPLPGMIVDALYDLLYFFIRIASLLVIILFVHFHTTYGFCSGGAANTPSFLYATDDYSPRLAMYEYYDSLCYKTIFTIRALFKRLFYLYVITCVVIPGLWRLAIIITPEPRPRWLAPFPAAYERFESQRTANIIQTKDLLLRAARFLFFKGICGLILNVSELSLIFRMAATNTCRRISRRAQRPLTWMRETYNAVTVDRRARLLRREVQAISRSWFGIVLILSALVFLAYSMAPLQSSARAALGSMRGPQATHTVHMLPSRTAHAYTTTSYTLDTARYGRLPSTSPDVLLRPDVERPELLSPQRTSSPTSNPTASARQWSTVEVQRPSSRIASTPRPSAEDFEACAAAGRTYSSSHSPSASSLPHAASHGQLDPSQGVHDNHDHHVNAEPSLSSMRLIVSGYRVQRVAGGGKAWCGMCRQQHGFEVMIADQKMRFD